jgi:hypothetical protein
MNNYKEKRKNVTGSVGPQAAAKDVTNCGCFQDVFQQYTSTQNC